MHACGPAQAWDSPKAHGTEGDFTLSRLIIRRSIDGILEQIVFGKSLLEVKISIDSGCALGIRWRSFIPIHADCNMPH